MDLLTPVLQGFSILACNQHLVITNLVLTRLAFNTTPTPGAATEWDAGTTSKVEVGRNVGADDMDSILVSRLDMLMQNSMTLR